MAETAPTIVLPERPGNIVMLGQWFLRHQSWMFLWALLDIVTIYVILNNEKVTEAWHFIVPGINVMLQITFISFGVALVLGLITAFGRISSNWIIYNLSTLYVELLRGLPLLVIIMIFHFALVPAIIDLVSGSVLDDLGQRLFGVDSDRIPITPLTIRDVDPAWRVTLAFAVTYGAFMSEVFRAGIESIGRGQMEAARSLGMTYFQAMIYVILPQAIRNVLPPLANNFIFLLKDTSLVTVVAVPEISHLARQYSSNRFRYKEGLLVAAFIYANTTLLLSMGVAVLESRLQQSRRGER
jgi:polar amino acid transport system permease protein